jgi:hypothetical protein
MRINKKKNHKLWSAQETERLMQLHAAGVPGDLLACHMPGRCKKQCRSKIHYELKQRGRPRVGRKNLGVAGARPPHEVLAEAHHRRGLNHPTLTARLCGDPLPGRSALDRRGTARPKTVTLAGRFSAS